MPGYTRFHLLRHAEHGLLNRVLTGRMPGVGLSSQGHTQAARLAATMADFAVRAIVTSPMERARQTAQPIAARLNLPLETEPDINEIDFGLWTGSTFEDLRAAEDWRAWNVFRSFAPTPGGESMLSVQTRALAAIARLRAAWPDADVAVVSHADVLKSILSHFLTLPLDLMRRIELAPASRSVLLLWDDDAKVEAINLPPVA